MKAKHQREWLEMKQKWYDKLPNSYKSACKRPGSVKTR